MPCSLVRPSGDQLQIRGVAFARYHVRFGSKADICSAQDDVRFTPDCDRKSGHRGPDGGRSISALPCTSNVDLLRNRDGIVHINAEISDGAAILV